MNKLQIAKDFDKFMKSLGDMKYDEALPLMQEEMWRIARENNTTGPKVFEIYMDWKSKQPQPKQ